MLMIPFVKPATKKPDKREPTDQSRSWIRRPPDWREQAQQAHAEQRAHRRAQHGEPLADHQNQDTDDDQKKWKHCVPP